MRELICQVCGKHFVELQASIYKVNYKGKTLRCCCYTCYRKAQKVKSKELPESELFYLNCNTK